MQTLKTMILSEIRQTQKDKYHGFYSYEGPRLETGRRALITKGWGERDGAGIVQLEHFLTEWRKNSGHGGSHGCTTVWLSLMPEKRVSFRLYIVHHTRRYTHTPTSEGRKANTRAALLRARCVCG